MIVSSKNAVFRRVTGSPKLVFTSVVESSTQWLIVLKSGSGFVNPFCPVGSSKNPFTVGSHYLSTAGFY